MKEVIQKAQNEKRVIDELSQNKYFENYYSMLKEDKKKK